MTIREWCYLIGYPMAPWLFFLLTGIFGGLMCVKRLREIHKTLGTVTTFMGFFFMCSLWIAAILG